MFGLHDNANIANISCALTETSELLDTMQSLHPQTGGGAGKSWGQTLLELAAVIAVALLNFPRQVTPRATAFYLKFTNSVLFF